VKGTEQTTQPIVQTAHDNDEFRNLLMTGEKMQVVLMSISAGGEIGGATPVEYATAASTAKYL